MTTPLEQRASDTRATFTTVRRLVVKIGTRVLTQKNGRPDTRRIRALVCDMADLRDAGREVILVSSGAIGAGMQALGMGRRPDNLPDLQMTAAVGQTRLMSRYDALFAARGLRVGQILLTHEDLRHRERHLNTRNTIENLLRHGVVPIVNENDVVSVDEIRLGDNDFLASLVAHLVRADLTVLLTTTDGLRGEPDATGRTRRVQALEAITPDVFALAQGKTGALSTGGMLTKLQAADQIARAGGAVVIANGRTTGILNSIFAGSNVGTLILPRAGRTQGMRGRKRWIAFFHRAAGTLTIDDGAGEAILRRGKSLLPGGVLAVEGRFPVGSLVNVKTGNGRLVARGLAAYDSAAIRKIMGRRTTDIAAILGRKDYDEIIHRDNLAAFGE